MIPKQVGARIRALRKVSDMKQSELANLLDLTQPGLSQWEKGKRLIPLDAADAIARHFNVTLDWIYYGDATSIPHGLALKLDAISEPYRTDDPD